MTVITVPSGADQDELWRRFARVIGVPDERARAMPTSRPKNASLGAISAELMLRVNARTRQLGWPQYRLGVKVPLAKRVLSSRAADEPRFALKPEHHKLLRERALTMVDAVAASPASVVGDLQEVIPPVEARAGSFSPGDVTDAELLDAALDGLAGYAGQLNRTRSERDALESALRGSSEAATAGSGRTRTLRTKASAVLRGLRRRVRS
jgi:hypothetical protein